jgi:hypothetical protein
MHGFPGTEAPSSAILATNVDNFVNKSEDFHESPWKLRVFQQNAVPDPLRFILYNQQLTNNTWLFCGFMT